MVALTQRSESLANKMEWLNRRPRTLAALLLSALLLFQLPAWIVKWWLPDSVIVSGVSGTLWSGQAARGWVQVGDRPLMLGRISWRITPWQLVWGTPVWLDSQWGDQLLQARVGTRLDGTVLVRDLRFRVDMALVRAVAPIFLGGTLTGDISELVLAGRQLEAGSGTLALNKAVWTANSGSIALGSYRMILDQDAPSIEGQSAGDAAAVIGKVTTLDGSLRIDGDIALSADRYRINLQAAGALARDEQFRRSVAVLATPSAEGFDIALEGRY